jgi:hypothetical protein
MLKQLKKVVPHSTHMNNETQHYPEHLNPLKYFAMAMFVILPFMSFLIGVTYEDMKFFDTADPRTRIFQTQEQCENFTNRKCLPTLCEQNPQHPSCATNNQTGWFATRQPIQQTISPTETPTESPAALSCMNAGGSWISEYNECEGLSGTQCTKVGGQFNECASACRHNPDPQAVCIQMCIPVCNF